jgi:hypothetical protein
MLLPPGGTEEGGEPPPPGTEQELLGPKYRLPDDIRIMSVQFPDGKEQTESEVKVDFSPLGEAGSHIVSLRNDREERIYVKFGAIVGALSYSDEEQTFEQYEED